MNLLEQYKGRLSVTESVYSRTHNGEKMDNHKKLVIAKVLDNTSKFLSEAFDAASGTQRSDLGLYKKFCLISFIKQWFYFFFQKRSNFRTKISLKFC